MARREVIELVDDLDGGPAERTVSFAVDGVSYEIDLSSEHEAELHQVLRPWADSGRKMGGARRRAAGASSRAGGPTAAQIRTWALSSSLELSSHGRIPREIRDAYDAAH